VFQHLDLGAPGIVLRQLIQPYQLRHDPCWVHPWRRECGCLLDGRPFSPAALKLYLDRSQFSANRWRVAPCREEQDEMVSLALEALNLGGEFSCPGVVPTEDCFDLGVDPAGQRFDHVRRHGLPELGQQRPL